MRTSAKVTACATLVAVGALLPTAHATNAYQYGAPAKSIPTHRYNITNKPVGPMDHKRHLPGPTRYSNVASTHKASWHNALPKSMRKPCATEDSVNCYWDAKVFGNGRGHSYIVRQLPGKAHMVCVFYVNKKDARKWDYCA